MAARVPETFLTPTLPVKPDRRITYAVVILATALIRLAFAHFICWPALGDSNYYDDVARHLARGEGLTSQCIWNFLRAPPTLPMPACGYWGPVVPWIIGAAYLVSGVTAVAGQIVMVALALVLAILGLEVARRVLDDDPLLILISGLLIALHFRLAYFSVTPDTPIPFAVCVNACLLPLGLAVAGWKPGYLVAVPGAVAALLTRADGLLIPLVVVGFTALAVVRRRVGIFTLLGVVALWMVLWAPWLVRNHQVFGTPFPAPTVESLCLTRYDDIHLSRVAPGPKVYFAQGMAKIAAAKWKALLHNLQIAWSGESRIFCVLLLFGLPALIRMPFAWPFLAYGVMLLTAFSLFFDQQTHHGSFFHSLPSLYPFAAAGSLLGLRRLLSWLPDRELTRVLRWLGPWLLVGWMALFTALALIFPEALRGMASEVTMVRGVIQGWRDRQGPAAAGYRYMCNFPLELLGTLHAPVVMTPLDDDRSLFEVADKYGLTHAVLFDEGSGWRWRWSRSVIREEGGTRQLRCIARWPLAAPVLEFAGVAVFVLEKAPAGAGLLGTSPSGSP